MDLQKVMPTLNKALDGVKTTLLQKKKECDGEAESIKLIVAVSDDDEFEMVKATITKANKMMKEVGEMRMGATRPIDQFKKDLIQVEKDIVGELEIQVNRVKSLSGDYELEKARKAAEEAAKIKRENDRKIEMDKIRLRMRTAVWPRLDEVIKGVCTALREGFEKMTLEDIDVKFEKLKAYQPKMKESIYPVLFNQGYDIDLIAKEEYEDIVKEIQREIPITKVALKYVGQVEEVVSELVEMVPERKEELERLEKAGKAARAKAEKEREERLAREAKEREEQERIRKEKEQQELEMAMEDLELEAEIGNVNVALMSETKVKKSLLKATVKSFTAYRELVEFFLKNGGDVEKLQFLADFAAKNGRPKIPGVEYNL